MSSFLLPLVYFSSPLSLFLPLLHYLPLPLFLLIHTFSFQFSLYFPFLSPFPLLYSPFPPSYLFCCGISISALLWTVLICWPNRWRQIPFTWTCRRHRQTDRLTGSRQIFPTDLAELCPWEEAIHPPIPPATCNLCVNRRSLLNTSAKQY